MNKRKARRNKARAKRNTYYNEFNKACAKYLASMGDKKVTLRDTMQSNEMVSTLVRLEQQNPQEIELIETALRNFYKALINENKESLKNG